MADLGNRRPLKSRGSAWARGAATALARAGVSPDAISFAGVLFAAAGGAALAASGGLDGGWRLAALAGGALGAQLRLVCNLLDGMVAVEHGKGSSAGPIWNELPDRFSDIALLLGAGCGAAAGDAPWAMAAGWAAALGAVLTAYVRELGRGLGQTADFSGPMAKPHRMAVLTAAVAVAAAEPLWGWRGQSMAAALALIALGTALTVARRTLTLAARLKADSSNQ
jgi:phosphatidylglycerophosphate synthase